MVAFLAILSFLNSEFRIQSSPRLRISPSPVHQTPGDSDMLQVQLKPGLKGGRWAYLRPLCGRDEASIDGTGSIDATQFLDRLLVSTPGTTVGAGKAKELAICDCDRLFAAIYLHYFGERVESNVTCQGCDRPFELSFSLPELMANLDKVTTTKATGPDREGIYTLFDGRQFRLPTAGDRDSSIGFDLDRAAKTLLERCIVKGDPTLDPESLQRAMEEVGAVLDVDLDASCPHCQASQTVAFDIQTYVLRALAFEKQFLHREVHRIAVTYGWGYQEILDLSREERRTFVRLIEADRGVQQRRRS